jgi:hypothetical protein
MDNLMNHTTNSFIQVGGQGGDVEHIVVRYNTFRTILTDRQARNRLAPRPPTVGDFAHNKIISDELAGSGE